MQPRRRHCSDPRNLLPVTAKGRIRSGKSALRTSGTGTQWHYDAQHPDVVVGTPALVNGRVTFAIPGTSAMLLKFP